MEVLMSDNAANAPLNTLKPEPGQEGSYAPKFHPLLGDWARQQLENNGTYTDQPRIRQVQHTELQRALQAEAKQHGYWEEWQGVQPGKAIYENPREQDGLLPNAKYGTEGKGYG
jgi:hypothetical protein